MGLTFCSFSSGDIDGPGPGNVCHRALVLAALSETNSLPFARATSVLCFSALG